MIAIHDLIKYIPSSKTKQSLESYNCYLGTQVRYLRCRLQILIKLVPGDDFSELSYPLHAAPNLDLV